MVNLFEKRHFEGKKVLLMGGEGFIGRNIAEVISEKFNCYSVGIEKSIFPERKDVFIKVNPYTEIIKDEFDAYVHLIDNRIDLEFFAENEMGMVKNMGIKKDKHLIIFSSAVVYANPGSEYGKRKILLEDVYKKFCKKNGINLTIFRLFNIYGKYQFPFRQGSLVANIFYNYLDRQPIEINDMDAMRDFIFAKDMGAIVKWVIENKFFGKADLATGELISIRDLLKVFTENIFSHEVEIIDKGGKEKNLCPTGGAELYANIKPTSLLEGLNSALSFYEKHNNMIKKHINK